MAKGRNQPLWYEMYGPPEFSVKGICSVPVTRGRLEGQFECVQVGDGGIYLQLEVPDVPEEMLVGPMGTGFEPMGEVTGSTSRGKPFVAKPLGIVSNTTNLGRRGSHLTACYVLGEAAVSEQDAASSISEYGLTNLVFTPNHQRWIGYRLLNTMRLELPSGLITIAPRRDYKQIEDRIRGRGVCSVTCSAKTRIGDEAVDEVCALLGLGQGSFVNWIWRDDYESRRRVRRVMVDRITRPFGGMPLLPVRLPGVIPQFVCQCLSAYRERLVQYRLGPIIRLICQARYGRYSDLETRGVTLAIVLEILSLAHSRERGTELRMPPGDYKAGVSTWRPLVRNALESAYGRRSDIDSMLGSIVSGLNRTPFATRLRAMAEDFKLPSESMELGAQVRNVVNTRNELIHVGRFRSKDPAGTLNEFFGLMEFTDRLVLKILDYSGPYMGWDGNNIVPKKLP
jgi:hypothetical protein